MQTSTAPLTNILVSIFAEETHGVTSMITPLLAHSARVWVPQHDQASGGLPPETAVNTLSPVFPELGTTLTLVWASLNNWTASSIAFFSVSTAQPCQ